MTTTLATPPEPTQPGLYVLEEPGQCARVLRLFKSFGLMFADFGRYTIAVQNIKGTWTGPIQVEA